MDSAEDLFFAVEAEVGRLHVMKRLSCRYSLVGLSSRPRMMDENLKADSMM